MRICFLSRRFFPAVSGMSVYAANLLHELAEAGHDVTMISQYRGDEKGTRIYGGGPPPAVPGVRVVGLEAVGEQSTGDFERDIEVMVETIVSEHRRSPFDVLHAQYGYPTGWAVVLAGRRIGVPTVVSIQGGDGHWVGSCCETHRLAMVRTLANANAVLIGGRSFVEEVAQRLGVDRDLFTIVPGAVDTRRFHPGRQASTGGPARLLYHGRIDRRKGALDFVEALALLRDAGIAFEAVLSGIGPDLDASRDLVAARKLQPWVRCIGPVDYDQVPAVYRDADVFVSPTYAEGFSNTILEAMACGLPIVSCRVIGVSDCLDDELAMLNEAGDVPALAASLRRLVGDAELRRRFGEAALAACRATYSWSAVGRQIMQVYAAVIRCAPSTTFDATLPMTPCRFRHDPHLL